MTLRQLLLLGAVISVPGSALAADLDPIFRQAPELVPVEIGTGWYLRGDVAYDFKSDVDGFRSLRSPFDSRSEAYGDAKLDEGFGGGLGVGYQFTDMLRGDVTARYSQPEFEGVTNASIFCGPDCSLRDRADTAMWDVMANAYVDLGTIAGFTPYIGGGVGAVHLSYEDPTMDICFTGGCSSVPTNGEDSWRFAWAANAGIAYSVSDSLKLDIGYRYLNVEGGDAWKLDGQRIGYPGGAATGAEDGFDRHTITAGVRYSLW